MGLFGSTSPSRPKRVDSSYEIARQQWGKEDARQFRNAGVADPELQSRLLADEMAYRPGYTAANLADQELSLLGNADQLGLVGLQGEAALQSELYRSEVARQQREADLMDVEQLGGRATEAMRASDPRTMALIGQQEGLTSRLYDRAAMEGRLTPQEVREAQQMSREAYGARGRLNDGASVAGEILSRDSYRRQKMMQDDAAAQGAGSQLFPMLRNMAVNPYDAILGRGTQSLGLGAQNLQQSLGAPEQANSKLFNADAGINMGLQHQANLQAYENAKAANATSMWGSVIGALGSAAGGALGRPEGG